MAVWKLWILLGLVLAVSEIVIVPAQFVLVALGVCAVIVGLVVAATGVGLGAQLGLYSALAIVLIPVFVRLWRRRTPVRYAGTAGESNLAAQVGVVLATEPLRIRLNSDQFPARSTDGQPLQIGDPVLVEGFNGITANIRKHPVS